MATATQREVVPGATYWNVTLDDGSRYIVAGANSAAAITVAQAQEAANQLPVANQATIVSRANAALAVNTTYLALGAPSVAQNTAQVQTLTKECNGLIRLALGLFDSTTGT